MKAIKILISIVILLSTISVTAQQGINYKALIKDGGGNVVASQTIDVRFTIIADTGPTNVYLETHTGATTDANGIIILNIGNGTTNDVFTDIAWGSDVHSLKVEIDIEQDASFVDMGTTQFMAVPYALNAANVTGLETLDEGNGIGWRLIDTDPANYGSIGLNAVDLSNSDSASSTTGSTGDFSTAMGWFTKAESLGSTAIGRYNIGGGNPNSYVTTDPLFEIGIGLTDISRANAFTVLKNGNVGIGTNSPGYILDVEVEQQDKLRLKSTSNDFDIILDGASGNNELEFYENGSFKASIGWDSSNDRIFCYQNGTNVLFVQSGRLGVKHPAPSYDLHLNNNSAAKPTSSSWTVASDSRLKTNVKPFIHGLKTLMQINPVWFTYNGIADMPQETGVGTIAQELAEIAPFMVSDWEHKSESRASTTYKAIDYGAMDFILINAIKEQQEIIKEQKEVNVKQTVELETLGKSIEKLLKRVEQIEATSNQ